MSSSKFERSSDYNDKNLDKYEGENDKKEHEENEDNDKYDKRSKYEEDEDYDRSEKYERSSRREKRKEQPKYTLSNLVTYLTQRKIFVSRQFVYENTTVFLKARIENIGENIFIYFPSKYEITPIETLPITEIVPYELSDEDLLANYQLQENEFRENFAEFQSKDLKNPEDTFSQEHYRALTIQEKNKENHIRKSIIKYVNQLTKFKSCFSKIKYKLVIMSNDVLCYINRHNDVDSYLIRSDEELVKNVIDDKTDTVLNIDHEMYFLIDLPSFYEKIPQLSTDVISLYRNFYNTLSSVHTKFTAVAEHRFRNYAQLVQQFIIMYNDKNKFLEMLDTLTASLDTAINQENKLIEKLQLIESKESIELSKNNERSYRLSKNEKELQKVKELKMKIINTIHEIKTKYHTFILTFDFVITNVVKHLKNIEVDINLLGINMQNLIVAQKSKKK
jgi:hypothetical protein